MYNKVGIKEQKTTLIATLKRLFKPLHANPYIKNAYIQTKEPLSQETVSSVARLFASFIKKSIDKNECFILYLNHNGKTAELNHLFVDAFWKELNRMDIDTLMGVHIKQASKTEITFKHLESQIIFCIQSHPGKIMLSGKH